MTLAAAVFTVLSFVLAFGAAPAPLTVIVGATLVDAGGKAPLEDAIVVLRDGRIEAVGDRAHTPIPKGAALVDGRRAWVAPAPAAPGKDVTAEIVALLAGAEPRIRAGQPAHLALLSGDPRKGRVEVKRRWAAGALQP
jgi:hypothetical protein